MINTTAHRKVKVLTGKSRRGIERPAKKPTIARFMDEPIQEVPVQILKPQKVSMKKEATADMTQQRGRSFDMTMVNVEMRKRAERREKIEKPTISAREIKEQEIAKAIQNTNRNITEQEKTQKHQKIGFGFKRIALAVTCAATVVAAIAYFVNTSSLNISSKVAAIQTGIDAHYPGYIPRDYNLSGITSENGKITLNFKNSSTGDAFTIVEEKSSWSGNDLYNEFVRQNFGSNYTVTSENGFNVYISGKVAVWVNDGIFYKITTQGAVLTKKQISTIAAKL